MSGLLTCESNEWKLRILVMLALLAIARPTLAVKDEQVPSMDDVEGASFAFMDMHAAWFAGSDLQNVGTENGPTTVTVWAVKP